MRPGISLASLRDEWSAHGPGEFRIGIAEIALLAVIGVAVGTYGTLVGLGGGFLIVPLLLLVYNLAPPAAAATSLVVVLLGAASGSVGYLRQRRVAISAGLMLAAGTVPGALIGPEIATHIPQRTFEVLFGGFLLAVAIFLLIKPPRDDEEPHTFGGQFMRVRRTLIDASGNPIELSFSGPIAIGVSLIVGVVASLFGIGGGAINVPAMIHLLGFPVHVAAATSTFVLSITSLVAVAEYTRRGFVEWPIALALGAGVVLGAQLATVVSHRIHAKWLVRLLMLAVLGLGVRLLVE